MELVICVGRFANAGVVGLRTNIQDRLIGVRAKCNLWSSQLVCNISEGQDVFFYCQSPEIVTVIEE